MKRSTSEIRARIGIFDSASWLGGSSYLRALLANLTELCSSGNGGADCEILAISKEKAHAATGSKWTSLNNDIHSCRTPYLTLLLSRLLPHRLPRGSHRVAAFAAKNRLTHMFPCSVGGISWPRRVVAADWIPDFGHVSAAENFTESERMHRDTVFETRVRNADQVFVSSDTDAAIYRARYPRAWNKLHIFKFRVAIAKEDLEADVTATRELFGLPRKYAIVCNQMWKHKKHDLVVRALHELKMAGESLCVVFTGPTEDRTNPDYPEHVKNLVRSLNVGDSCRILGKIARNEQIALLRGSSFLIQPSVSEGWNTAVEEARCFGKPIIMSDIPVHCEQAYSRSMLVQAGSLTSLVDGIRELWNNSNPGPAIDEDASMRKYDMLRRESAATFLEALGVRVA